MDAVKKKPALSLVIGMGKGDGSKGEPKSDDAEPSGELDVALEELFEAIKSDDLEAFKSAYRAVKAC